MQLSQYKVFRFLWEIFSDFVHRIEPNKLKAEFLIARCIVVYLTSCKLPFQIWSAWDDGVRVWHHGNQHVQQHDYVAHWVTAKHQQAPKPEKNSE